jgi:hypothetical protein
MDNRDAIQNEKKKPDRKRIIDGEKHEKDQRKEEEV